MLSMSIRSSKITNIKVAVRLNVLHELPGDISARKQCRRYRCWFLIAMYVALIPICTLLVAVVINRVNELPYHVVFIGMMMSALGIFTSVFTYRPGHQPDRSQLYDPSDKRE